MSIWNTILYKAQRMVRRSGKALVLLRTPTYRRALVGGTGAAIEHEAVLKSLTFASLIDVGANVGQFSIVVKRLFPRTLIHAFEPLPDAASKFRENFKGQDDVTLHQVALGAKHGTASIHVSGSPDSSSLLPIGRLQADLFPGTAEASKAEIVVVRGADLLNAENLPSPILLKLDVQGFELEALQGFREALHRISYIYAEVSFVELYDGQPLAHEIIAWLRDEGFDLAAVYNVTLSRKKTAIQADALFARKREASNR